MNNFIFNIYYDIIVDNLYQMADINRIWLYENHRNIFEKIEYENDNAFLESELFFHNYNKTKSEDIIRQLLFRYISDCKEDSFLFADNGGLINIENICYYLGEPNQIYLYKDVIKLEKIDCINIVDTNIKILRHVPFILRDTRVDIEINHVKNIDFLNSAFGFFKDEIMSLYELFKLVLKGLFIFNSNNENSMASRAYLGTIFINTLYKDNNVLYFIEEIAHQAGHNLFYLLIFNEEDFFLHHPNKKFGEVCANFFNDERTLEIVFHSLFTLYLITLSLQKYIESTNSKYMMKDEALYRLGFYFYKMEQDIYRLNPINEILSEKGLNYYFLIKKHFMEIKKKYLNQFSIYNYENQPYVFDMEIFKFNNL